MRVAHTTDIHWFHPPPLWRLSPKRWLGTVNLYLRGRRHEFHEDVQAALVDAILEQAPDAVVITGDLTAQALPAEFRTARLMLDPLLSRVPTLVQAGNHDVYTGGSFRQQRIRRWFGDAMRLGPDGLARLVLPGLTVIGLDPNRPHWSASGVLPAEQLAALPAALGDVPEDHALVLALHYPILHRDGSIYAGWEHGLRNAGQLVEVLRASPRKPDLIVHGHVHHGYRVDLDLDGVRVPICNPGSGGYALPERDRAACFNVYTFEGRTLAHVERFRWDGTAFRPEPGGAYATGR